MLVGIFTPIIRYFLAFFRGKKPSRCICSSRPHIFTDSGAAHSCQPDNHPLILLETLLVQLTKHSGFVIFRRPTHNSQNEQKKNALPFQSI